MNNNKITLSNVGIVELRVDGVYYAAMHLYVGDNWKSGDLAAFDTVSGGGVVPAGAISVSFSGVATDPTGKKREIVVEGAPIEDFGTDSWREGASALSVKTLTSAFKAAVSPLRMDDISDSNSLVFDLSLTNESEPLRRVMIEDVNAMTATEEIGTAHTLSLRRLQGDWALGETKKIGTFTYNCKIISILSKSVDANGSECRIRLFLKIDSPERSRAR
jgi:hypothetical protein